MPNGRKASNLGKIHFKVISLDCTQSFYHLSKYIIKRERKKCMKWVRSGCHGFDIWNAHIYVSQCFTMFPNLILHFTNICLENLSLIIFHYNLTIFSWLCAVFFFFFKLHIYFRSVSSYHSGNTVYLQAWMNAVINRAIIYYICAVHTCIIKAVY